MLLNQRLCLSREQLFIQLLMKMAQTVEIDVFILAGRVKNHKTSIRCSCICLIWEPVLPPL